MSEALNTQSTVGVLETMDNNSRLAVATQYIEAYPTKPQIPLQSAEDHICVKENATRRDNEEVAYCQIWNICKKDGCQFGGQGEIVK